MCFTCSVLLTCQLGFPSLPPSWVSTSFTHCLVPGVVLCQGCYGDLLAAEEIVALLFCYPPIVSVGFKCNQALDTVDTSFMFCSFDVCFHRVSLVSQLD